MEVGGQFETTLHWRRWLVCLMPDNADVYRGATNAQEMTGDGSGGHHLLDHGLMVKPNAAAWFRAARGQNRVARRSEEIDRSYDRVNQFLSQVETELLGVADP